MRARQIFASAAIIGLFASLPALAAESARVISFIPKNHPVLGQTHVWVKQINTALEGKFKINYIGGPEVIPRRQQVQAVGNGVIDMSFTVPDYLDQVPEAFGFVLSKLSPAEERTSGFYDLMVEVHHRLNIQYLGRVLYSPFYLWTNIKPTKLADLKGLRMRTGSLYDRLMRNFGMTPVTISSKETYTALERGLVDGFGWPNVGPRQRGWLKKVRYVIDLPFFQPSNVIIVMNRDKWNGFSKGLRDQIMSVTATYEPKMVAFYQGLEAREWKEIDKLGVERVKFSSAENKQYLDAAYELEWAQLAKKVKPGMLARLRKVSGN